MSTDDQAVEEPVDQPVAEDATGDQPTADEGPDGRSDEDGAGDSEGDGQDQGPRPNWWHRDHPTFAALTGFFTGLLFVALVPAVYVAVLSLVLDSDRVEELFPFVLVTLVVPLGLVASTKTRRFGTYFWIGMVLTAVVVVGVGALVLWYLVENQK